MGYAQASMMRRALESAALAASTGAASLCVLVLYLNPARHLRLVVVALALCLFVPWTLAGAAALWLVAASAAGLRWWPRPFRPVVEGQPFLASLTFLVLAVVAALYWHNLLSYRHSIPVESLRALAASSVVMTVSAFVLVAVGLDVLLFPRHDRSLASALAILAPAAAVVVPLALRPEPVASTPPIPVRLDAQHPARRLIVVGIDGLGPADVQPDAAGGHIPSLSRLARRGAFGPLATLQPTEGPPIWTTLLTGRLPRDHGIESASTYRLRASAEEWALLPKGTGVGLLERAGLVARRPVTSASRKRRALWNVLDAFEIPSGLVGVWATHPPEKIRGFVLSPYFYVLRGDPERAPGALLPKDLLAEVEARAVNPSNLDPALLRELTDAPAVGRAPLEDRTLRGLVEQALAPDLTSLRAAEVLRSAYAPAFFVIAFHGYDAAGHAFYRYAHPEVFGDVTPEKARRYGRVLVGYASFLGQWISRLEQGLGAGDVLVVLSGHGLQPTPLWRRLIGVLTGTTVADASHGGAPDGFFLAVGDGIRPGAVVQGASVVDVAPTLLYLMGLPVARDMEGRVLTEIVDEAFAADNPVTFIPSYESLAVAPAAPAPPAEELPPLPEEGA
jgi:predicted AlkP superfamily phosphohydrolase/phosphomutase